jgi:CDP-diacylglycerol---serine O-phosphatidyltransferase
MNMQRRPPKLRRLHINRVIPNVLTLLALAAGLSAFRFALEGRWEHAVLAIVAAGIFDALDGRVARMLRGQSRFGAELDSLSDFVCFSVAPGLVLYLWALQEYGRFGWSLVLLLCMCCALRLARFNTALDDEVKPAWTGSFFTGIPSPAGAGLVMLPMVFWLQLDADFLRQPAFVGVFMVAGAFLMISKVRTFSLKRLRIPQTHVLPVMFGCGVYLAILVTHPWITLGITQIAYLASIPFSARMYRRLARESVEDDTRAAERAPVIRR